MPPGVDGASLGVVELRGSYAGRKVVYFRVFDAARAAERMIDVDTFGDLHAHRNLVLRTGHVEKSGAVVVSWRAPTRDAAIPAREPADRAMHAGDERVVFPQGARVGLGAP